MITSLKVVEAQDLLKRKSLRESLIPIIIDDGINTPWPAAMPSEQIAGAKNVADLITNLSSFDSVDIVDLNKRIQQVTKSLEDIQIQVSVTQSIIDKTKSLIESASNVLAYSEYDGTVSATLSGSGTEDDPYLIKSAADFAFAFPPSNSEKESLTYYRLDSDLEFFIKPFLGFMTNQVLDCNGRVIKIKSVTGGCFLFLDHKDAKIINLKLDGFLKLDTSFTVLSAADSLESSPILEGGQSTLDIFTTDITSLFSGISSNSFVNYGTLQGKVVSTNIQNVNQAAVTLNKFFNLGKIEVYYDSILTSPYVSLNTATNTSGSSDITTSSGILINNQGVGNCVLKNCINYGIVESSQDPSSRASEIVVGTNTTVENSWGFGQYNNFIVGSATGWIYGIQVVEYNTTGTLDFRNNYDSYSYGVKKLQIVNKSVDSITVTIILSEDNRIPVNLSPLSSAWFYLVKKGSLYYLKRLYSYEDMLKDFKDPICYTGKTSSIKEGIGSKDNPYLIASASEFASINTICPLSNTEEKYFSLQSDIDFNNSAFKLECRNAIILLNGRTLNNLNQLESWHLVNSTLKFGKLVIRTNEMNLFSIIADSSHISLVEFNLGVSGAESYSAILDNGSTIRKVTFTGSVQTDETIDLIKKGSDVVSTYSLIRNDATLKSVYVSILNRHSTSAIDSIDQVINIGTLQGEEENLLVKENPVINYGSYQITDLYSMFKIEETSGGRLTLAGTQYVQDESTELNYLGTPPRYLSYPLNIYLPNGLEERTVIIKIRGSEIPVYQQNGALFLLKTNIGVGYTKYTLWFNSTMSAVYSYNHDI